MKGLKDILSVKFKPIDKHMEESPDFRDKVVKNSTSIFWLKVITISLIPVCLGWLGIFVGLLVGEKGRYGITPKPLLLGLCLLS